MRRARAVRSSTRLSCSCSEPAASVAAPACAGVGAVGVFFRTYCRGHEQGCGQRQEDRAPQQCPRKPLPAAAPALPFSARQSGPAAAAGALDAGPAPSTTRRPAASLLPGPSGCAPGFPGVKVVSKPRGGAHKIAYLGLLMHTFHARLQFCNGWLGERQRTEPVLQNRQRCGA